MKKSLFSLLLIFISFFVCSKEVLGSTQMSADNTQITTTGGSILVCEYKQDSTGFGDVDTSALQDILIYYTLDCIDGKNCIVEEDSGWEIYYKAGSSVFSQFAWTGYLFRKTYKIESFSGNDRFFNQIPDQKFTDDNEKNFQCPKYAYVDTTNVHTICLTDNEGDKGENNGCGTNAFKDHGPYPLVLSSSNPTKENGDSIFSVIYDYASKHVCSEITDDEYVSNNTLGDVIVEKTYNHINSIYYFGTMYEMPNFVNNYIKNINNYVSEEDSCVAQMQQKKQDDAAKDLDNGKITQEEYDDIAEQSAKSVSELIGAIKLKICDDPKCYGLLGENMTIVVNNIFDFVKYAGPILVVVLTSIDLIKASVSGSKDELKKVSQDFAKRAVAAILLFFIPLVCSMLFELAGITVPENCIGQSTYESTDCDT